MHALPSSPSISSNAAVAVGFVAAVAVASTASLPLAVAAVLAVAAGAAWVDIKQRRIPDELVIVALVPSLVATLVGAAPVGDVALGILIFGSPLFVVHLVSPISMGFGDVKLAVPLGAALGVVDPTLGLIALCVASGVTATAALVLRRSAVPFAPGLVAGTTVALALFFSTDWLLPWR